MRFRDRTEAGMQLAEKLQEYAHSSDTIVLGLPRGGVVVGSEIAKRLDVSLDIIIVRKIGAPFNQEFAVGALTVGGTIYLNKQLMDKMGLSVHDITPTIELEQKEAQRREQKYRSGREPLDLKDKVVILVDDGIATGATMYAAIMASKALQAKKIIVAAPVMPTSVFKQFSQEVDQVVCLFHTDEFYGIGQFYDSFTQVSDDQIVQLLS